MITLFSFIVQFLVRHPRNGRIPVEKMDMMNTVNQLLAELDKTKAEKVSLEEELKVQKLCHVRDRIQRTITSRDVDMAASSKVYPILFSKINKTSFVPMSFLFQTKRTSLDTQNLFS